MKSWRYGSLIALIALFPLTLFGQAQTTGSVTGSVVTDQGSPIANAEITLSGPAIQGDRSSRTGSNGQYVARLLPPGEYTAVVSAPGYQTGVFRFRVLVGETVPLNVTLYPGSDLAEEIVVTGRTSPLETTETRQTFEYTTEVEELPVQNRNINFVALMAPNTSYGPNSDPRSTAAPQVAIAGAPAFDTVVLLDGAEISDPYFGSGTTVYLEDSIQEVQVLSTGISARYGRFQGGVINAITKSGGNEFSGTLRAELDNESWDAQTPFEESQTDKLNQIYQATLGGYILRDRLWFFGGYRTIPSTSTSFTTETTSESFATTASEDRWQLKLRGAINPSHTLDVSYLEYDASLANYRGLPAGDLLAANGRRGDPRTMTSITYQGILGTSTFLDAMATEKSVRIVSGGSPDAGDPFLWSTPGNWVYNNHWWDATDPSVRDNQTASLNLSHSLDAGAMTHLLQGGVQYVESNTAGDNRQSATGYNLFAFTQNFNPRVSGGQVIFDLLPGEAQRWVATDLSAQNEVVNTALYLQDTLDWNRFRFDLGVRYDMYRGETTGVQAFDLDFNDISPRIGVTFNLTPALQLVGTWGKYVGRFNDNWAQAATGVSSAPREVYTYSGPALTGATRDQIQAALRNDTLWTLSNVIGDPAFPTTWVSGDAESPHTNEYNLSVRTALPRSSGFAALTYTNREYKNLMTGFVGLACTDFGLCEGAGDYAPLPGNRRTDTTVWANDSRAKRDYEALNLQVDYRPKTRLIVGGNWTYSETKGNYEGEALNQPASGSIFGTREREIPIELAAPYGFLNPHVPHRANVYTTYRFDFSSAGSLSTSAILNYESGRVWSRAASVPRGTEPLYAARPTGTYIHFFDGRGNNSFNDVWSLDVAGRYSLPIFGGAAPFVKLAVTNVTNNDTLTSYQTTGQAVRVNNPDGTLSHYEWAPTGNCGPEDEPSTTCTGFGRIRGQQDYQLPRQFLLSVGIQF